MSVICKADQKIWSH